MQFPVFKHASFAFAILWLSGLPCSARVGLPPTSFQRHAQSLALVPQLRLRATDSQAELSADMKRGNQVPLRFAVEHRVQISPETHGVWENLPNGRLWRFRLVSAGATDLNLGFTSFWLPD